MTRPLNLLASALLFSVALPGWAIAQQADGPKRAAAILATESCKPVYPNESLGSEHQGVVTLAFLIGRDGSVRDTRILGSSGHRPLDMRTVAALSTCRFTPAVAGGEIVERWLPVQYVWTLYGSSGLSVEQHVRRAAEQGNVDAKFALSSLPGDSTPEARAQRQRWLRAAAEEGHAMAQYMLGESYARGYQGLAVDQVQALAWYQKSAAQGNVLARQHLEELASQQQRGTPAP